jgi:predicted Zn-dependent protease
MRSQALLLLAFAGSIAAQAPTEPIGPAARLRDKVEKLTPAFDAPQEERDKATEAISELLSERLDSSQSAAELETICEIASDYLIAGGYAKPFAIPAARKALRLAPQRPVANMCLAMALWQQAQDEISRERNDPTRRSQDPDWYDAPARKRRKIFLEAEEHALLAIANKTQPEWLDYANLADIQEQIEGRDHQTFASNRRALAAAQRAKDESAMTVTLQNLWPQALNVGEKEQAKRYFAQLASIRSNASDWFIYAYRMADEHEFEEAGKAYMRAAELSPAKDKPGYFSSAALQYWLASKQDAALDAARKALADTSPAEMNTASESHRIIGEILFDRGVYEEALRHSQEAVSAKADDFRVQLLLARTLNKLHRNTEAIAAANNALKISEGKFPFVHFVVGEIYFDMAQWADAEEAFKHAAALDKTDTAATFNVALCLENQGYRGDAADWFEETLRRNPKHPKRTELERRIKKLRSQ